MSEARVAIAFPPWNIENYGMKSLILETANFPSFEQLDLCPECHQWGADPVFHTDTHACLHCERTPADVADCHGIVFLAELLVPDIMV